ncbi:hypothetical protein [Solibacillus sp. R5-41]|uniref:hypothetical protein n=1 Tax=Solibacillus sp. R5-41 TaxID=2048654 RepID=UPI0020A29E9C|nr:hypothetical protein [Solibacillus sp. R5-41]
MHSKHPLTLRANDNITLPKPSNKNTESATTTKSKDKNPSSRNQQQSTKKSNTNQAPASNTKNRRIQLQNLKLMDRVIEVDSTKPLSPLNNPNPNPNPDMSVPPVRYEFKTIDEVIRMRRGDGPTTKRIHGDKNIEAHHRGQIPISEGGVFDELEEYTHIDVEVTTQDIQKNQN